MLCDLTQHNSESIPLPYYPSIQANCPSSLLRNKAKNALSLAKSISPDLTGAKIDKISFSQMKNSKTEMIFVVLPKI